MQSCRFLFLSNFSITPKDRSWIAKWTPIGEFISRYRYLSMNNFNNDSSYSSEEGRSRGYQPILAEQLRNSPKVNSPSPQRWPKDGGEIPLSRNYLTLRSL